VLDRATVERLTVRPALGPTDGVPSKESSPLGVSAGAMAAVLTGRAESKGPATASTREEADRLNQEFGLRVGAEVEFYRVLRAPVRLKVVGITAPPPLGGRPQIFLHMPTLQELSQREGRLSEIDVILREGEDPNAFVERRRAGLPETVLLQTTEKITSGLTQTLENQQMGLTLATIFAYLAASFIIMTGLSTSITERRRELAVLRCLGATRWQLAQSQLWGGAIVGGLGALVGVPLGVAFAAVVFQIYKQELAAPLTIEPWGLSLAAGGAVLAGLIGATLPAFQAARLSPLAGLSSRAEPVRTRGIAVVGAFALLAVATHLGVIYLPNSSDILFWFYVFLGAPALFIGYFTLGVPMVALVNRALAPALERLLGLPRHMLARNVRATPYRHGFVAGAMMAGLALMVALWTQGGGVMRDWFGKLRFPDAFVLGTGLSPDTQRAINELDQFVSSTCAISLQSVETRAFGVTRLQRPKSTFVAFEPAPFFSMTTLQWVQGDLDTALPRLEQGGAILVAREFLIANGLGVGDKLRLTHETRSFDFEIVGVVTSPGLDIVSKFFDLGDDLTDRAVHSVFGSRRDLEDKLLGAPAPIPLIQVGLKEGADDRAAVKAIREKLLAMGSGVLEVGSGKAIRRQIEEFFNKSLVITAAVAVLAMLVACFGVANLIIASIQARQFEFGVLRALGGTRGVVVRLVLGEAVIIAAAAAVLGTLMGVQGAAGGQRLNEVIWGIQYAISLPWGPIAAGWGVVVLMTLGAAAPAVAALARKSPRELIAAMKG
jgi:putative ABC transport system permease protein